MAQQPRRPSADAAPFVRDIVSDPKNVPDVILLYGYLGTSSEEGHDRLYLSPDLTNYVEVPKDGVLHQMAAPKEQDPHGGVTLWVKKDAKLTYKMSPAAQALAHYFSGAVQAAGAGTWQAVGPWQAVGAAARPIRPTIVGATCYIRCSWLCSLGCSIRCPGGGPAAFHGPVACAAATCVMGTVASHYWCTQAAACLPACAAATCVMGTVGSHYWCTQGGACQV
jgi:hypothetical protein